MIDSKTCTNSNKELIKGYDTIADLLDNSCNLLMHIDDLFKNLPEMSDVFTNALLYYAIFPVVIARLLDITKHSYISINTALLILTQIIHTVSYEPLILAICGALFYRNIPNEWKKCIEDFPENVKNYSKNWKFFKCESEFECIFHCLC